MIEFNTEQIEKLTARDRLFRRIAFPVAAAIIVIGIIAATLFASANDKYETAHLVLLIINSFLLVIFFAFSMIAITPNSVKLKNEVKGIMYADLNAHREIFAGDNVLLKVGFSKNVLTISSQGGSRQYDLTAIRRSLVAYSACGNMLYDYILAYWQEACKAGFKGDVKCLDETTKRAETIEIVKSGTPMKTIKNAQKILNYGKGAEM